MFSRQTLSSTAQLLTTLEPSLSVELVYKHYGSIYTPEFMPQRVTANISSLRNLLRFFSNEQLFLLLEEIVQSRRNLRLSANPKYSFDERFADFEGWLRYDGWRIDEGRLIKADPALEGVVDLDDDLKKLLASTQLDQDGELSRMLDLSSDAFRASPANYNASCTHSRILLEKIGIRLACNISKSSFNKWGEAIGQLKKLHFIDDQTEKTICNVYTFISPGAHKPISIDEEEWARLSKNFALSTSYYLLKLYEMSLHIQGL